MRHTLKTVSVGPIKFIPKSHSEDQALSETAKEIQDRPMVFMVRKLTREDRLNIQGLLETAQREKSGEAKTVAVNLGTVARYVFENCVVEVKNVLIDDDKFESLKGRDKDRLFDTDGIDLEIMDAVNFVNEISSLSEAEAKN